jgi:hypothetical protein
MRQPAYVAAQMGRDIKPVGRKGNRIFLYFPRGGVGHVFRIKGDVASQHGILISLGPRACAQRGAAAERPTIFCFMCDGVTMSVKMELLVGGIREISGDHF